MKNTNLVWIVDDDRSIRWVLEKAFTKAGIEVECFADGNDILKRLESDQPSIIVSDIRMPGVDGLRLLDRINHFHSDVPVIIMTAHSDMDSALSAYQGGAYEYLPKPFDINEAVALVSRALNTSDKNETKENTEEYPEIIGEAPSMQEVFRAIGRLSSSNITVLITGESGTGKELVANALHKHSPRENKPFIALNMAAIPSELMESELFGHEKGAFTGATASRKGHFELANGGTLFLDEIGDMHSDLQSRLLRVLANGEFFRVGGHTAIKVDVRIIAATHQNLESLVEEKLFREDLFHRLNVIRVNVPALRERKEDIPTLINFFLAKAANELSVPTKSPIAKVYTFLKELQWPGNVRQLENACRWMTVMASGNDIHMEEMPPELLDTLSHHSEHSNSWESALRNWADNSLSLGGSSLLSKATPVFERVLIETAMKHTGGRRQDAAKLLGWGRNTLTRKIKELGMD
ncbi:Nitrogen regulation protein NR(I), GlnG (=NtrC) [hydrothermal vent metagenome]|uniref:DNA-binding transcriptional regulator NtrC n=1 Tax=hydrothermal vent metagenome TaxID=652676 RepID=A0A3B0YVB6_9ZZZZ